MTYNYTSKYDKIFSNYPFAIKGNDLDECRRSIKEHFNLIHEEMLLAYCGCYGVDSSDVELLLEYGYTCDEIEEMLADHDLLHEALRDVKYMCGEDLYESCYGGAF